MSVYRKLEQCSHLALIDGMNIILFFLFLLSTASLAQTSFSKSHTVFPAYLRFSKVILLLGEFCLPSSGNLIYSTYRAQLLEYGSLELLQDQSSCGFQQTWCPIAVLSSVRFSFAFWNKRVGAMFARILFQWRNGFRFSLVFAATLSC